VIKRGATSRYRITRNSPKEQRKKKGARKKKGKQLKKIKREDQVKQPFPKRSGVEEVGRGKCKRKNKGRLGGRGGLKER